MNPNRVCGMCKMTGRKQPSMVELLESLPDVATLTRHHEYGDNIAELDVETVKRLRHVADNCPACIMAALRQKKIPVCKAADFDFTKECKSIWSDFNQNQAESYAHN